MTIQSCPRNALVCVCLGVCECESPRVCLLYVQSGSVIGLELGKKKALGQKQVPIEGLRF